MPIDVVQGNRHLEAADSLGIEVSLVIHTVGAA